MKVRTCVSKTVDGAGTQHRCSRDNGHPGACWAGLRYGAEIMWGRLPTLDEIENIRAQYVMEE